MSNDESDNAVVVRAIDRAATLIALALLRGQQRATLGGVYEELEDLKKLVDVQERTK